MHPNIFTECCTSVMALCTFWEIKYYLYMTHIMYLTCSMCGYFVTFAFAILSGPFDLSNCTGSSASNLKKKKHWKVKLPLQSEIFPFKSMCVNVLNAMLCCYIDIVCHSCFTHFHALINLLFCVHLFWHRPLFFFVFCSMFFCMWLVRSFVPMARSRPSRQGSRYCSHR